MPSCRRHPRAPQARCALALAAALAAAVAGAACTPRPDGPDATPSPGTVPGSPPASAPAAGAEPPEGGAEGEEEPVLVRVESLEASLLESFPVQVHAHLAGNLSDACVELGEAEVRREGATFTITLPASRPPDRMCAQVLVPFTRTVPLPVRDLPAGEYRIESHGAAAAFSLARDNSFDPR